MKKFLSFILVLTVLITSFSATAYAAETEANTITVTGTGTINVMPDVANITLGASATNADAKIAQGKVNEIITKVVAEIKKLGIEEKDIKTQYVSLYPNYDRESNVTTYTANTSIAITVRDILIAGTVIDKAIESGANNNSGISYSVSNPEKYYNDALVEAISNAKAKGNVMANAIGANVKNVVSVTEQSQMYVTPLYARAEVTSKDSGSGSNTNVNVGEVSINANVQLVLGY